MSQARIDELGHEIHDVCERLTELDRTIERCGVAKRQTRWFTDRLRAREERLVIRKRLYRERFTLLAQVEDGEIPELVCDVKRKGAWGVGRRMQPCQCLPRRRGGSGRRVGNALCVLDR
jgi:hypothetical protein